MDTEDLHTAKDDVFENYDHKVTSAIRPFGGDLEDLYEHKLQVLKGLLDSGGPMGYVLDYGCGMGHLSAMIAGRYPERNIIAFDKSRRLIDTAKNLYRDIGNLTFCSEMPGEGDAGLVLAVNILHHVPVPDRAGVLGNLQNSIGPDGKIAIIEHNPGNPVTRRVVRNCELDRGVVLIHPGELLALARECGLKCSQKKYILFFPSILKSLRGFEKFLWFLPLGAQYLMVFEKMRKHAA
jgi:SAM-dependent methyltransferase